jgi:hypothetical protein
MSDEEFLAQLEACTLPAEKFHHADHLRAAFLYLDQFRPAEAIARFSEVLRRFAGSLGRADRYHETVTWAYLLILNERIYRRKEGMNWQQFAAANPDLLEWNNSVLLKYYRKETLESDLARDVFLMPDRISAT